MDIWLQPNPDPLQATSAALLLGIRRIELDLFHRPPMRGRNRHRDGNFAKQIEVASSIISTLSLHESR